MKTILFVTTAIVASIAALPAAADPREPMKPATETTAAAPAQAARTVNTRYCIKETLVPSRIPLKMCHTRAEWSDRGVEIPADK